REFNGEAGASRGVVGDSDAAAMLSDDAADDGQAQTAAALFRRVVRQKELLALSGRNTWTVVRHDHPHDAVGPVVLGLDINRTAAIHRLDRIVHEIDDDASYLFLIDADLRQPFGEVSPELH